MTLDEVMQQLQQLGSDSIKKVLVNHGAREPFYGVKIEDLKKIQKKIKADYVLSLELYDTGVSDAMYLAGLIAEPMKMTRDDLYNWVEKAYWYMLSEFTVAWVASESRYGMELGVEWIDSDEEMIAAAGWATLASLASIKNDEDIDEKIYIKLLERVSSTIHIERNRVRQSMNNFVISVGGYCKHLSADALRIAASLGTIGVDMGNTACKVPDATTYIRKMIDRGSLTKKKKSARC